MCVCVCVCVWCGVVLIMICPTDLIPWSMGPMQFSQGMSATATAGHIPMTGWFQEAEEDGHHIQEAKQDDLIIWTDGSNQALHLSAGGEDQPALASFSASNGAVFRLPVSLGNGLRVQHDVNDGGESSVALVAASNASLQLVTDRVNIGRLTGSAPTITMDVATGLITAVGGLAVTSDLRVKSNVQQIHDAVKTVQRLSGYTFDRRMPDGTLLPSMGLVAQEVAEVLPSVVVQTAHSHELGAASPPLMAIKYSELCGLLVEAVKGLARRVDSLEQGPAAARVSSVSRTT